MPAIRTLSQQAIGFRHRHRVLMQVGSLLLLCFASHLMAAPAADAIDKVDFRSMDYGAFEELAMEPDQTYKVIKGKVERDRGFGYFSVNEVQYGDLDNDGRTDAVVHTFDNHGGTGTFSMLTWFYIEPDGTLTGRNIDGGDRSDNGVAAFKFKGSEVTVQANFGDAACCANGVVIKQFTASGGGLKEISPRRVGPSTTQPPEALRFAKGAHAADIRLAGSAGQYRQVTARKGQTLTLQLTQPVAGSILQVIAPNGKTLAYDQANASLQVVLPVSGAYIVGAIAAEVPQVGYGDGIPGALRVAIR